MLCVFTSGSLNLEAEEGERKDKEECLLLLASKFENPNLVEQRILLISAKKVRKWKCKYLDVRYRRLMVGIHSNTNSNTVG